VLAALHMFIGSGFFFGIIFTVVMLKYAYAVLAQTAQGKLSPPPITLALLNDDLGQVFKQIAILIVALAIAPGLVAGSLGPAAAIVFWFLAILCLPAMIMGLVATNSLVHALNPLVFGGIIIRIGGNYFLMYLFLIFLLEGPGLFAGQLAGFLPAGLTVFIYSAAKNYYMVMVYNLMGYTLLQYHEEIGFEVDYEEAMGTQAPAESGSHNILLGEVDLLVKEGKLDEAIALIREDTGGEISDLRLAGKYFNLLKIKKSYPELLEYGVLYLDLLADDNKKDEAAAVYRQCLGIDKAFTPRPDTLFKMGKWLAWDKEPKLALNLLVKFTRNYPDHPLLPDVYFFLAKLFHTRMKDHDKTKQILAHLISKYSGHPAAESAEKYARQLT
jgi:tetratricopeptide (TPR) repeat protein